MSRTVPSLHALIVALFSLTIGLSGCGKSKPAASAESTGNLTSSEDAPASAASPVSVGRPAVPPKPAEPIVVVHTTQGEITIKLFPEKAPRTVENFLRGYAERGFYDQTVFHHIEPGVMLIGGGYTADLQRKTSRAPIYNESKNGLTNRRGTVAMIRDPESPHSATSEFFINLADNPAFDFRSHDSEDIPGYCVFGEVVSGMDVVERISQLPVTSQGDFSKVPSPQVAIERVRRLQ